MKKSFVLLFLLCSLFSTYGQDNIRNSLINQGTWFLFSSRTEEHFDDDDKTLTQVDFFKKADVSSLFFDNDDKLYSVFSKDGSDVLEDLWQLVNENHFVIVSPIDSSPQLMDILELNTKKLVIRNCADIDTGTRCIINTYFANKDGWLSDKEVDELNSVGVIDLEEISSVAGQIENSALE